MFVLFFEGGKYVSAGNSPDRHTTNSVSCCNAAMSSDRGGGGADPPKPKLGLIVLQNDYTLEDDARYLLAAAGGERSGASLHVTRVAIQR